MSPQVTTFIGFVCFAASTAAAFVTAPVIEFLAALFLLFAYSTKFNERFKGFHWPLMVRSMTYCTKWTLCTLFFQISSCLLFYQGLPALCQCLHHLLHYLYNIGVKVSRWSFQGCRGQLTKVISHIFTITDPTVYLEFTSCPLSLFRSLALLQQ